MAEISQLQVETALKAHVDPYLEKDLVSAKAVREIRIDGGKVSVDVVLGFPAKGYADRLAQDLRERIEGIEGVESAEVNVSWKVASHAVQRNLKPLKSVKNIIAVASGKGGVGKSTVAVNLALALSAEGASVGILDADIYGPSQPRMLGIKGKPESKDGRTLEPMVSYHLQAMSIGFLIDEETPMIWRGPMVTQALEQLLNETNWKDRDQLEGPGLSGGGPAAGHGRHPAHAGPARAGERRHHRHHAPGHRAPGRPQGAQDVREGGGAGAKCGHEEHIFGEGGGRRLAEQYGVDFLGSLPLDASIRESTDGGRPTVVADPEGRIAQMYRDIARRAAARLSQQAKDYSAKFPQIMIQNT